MPFEEEGGAKKTCGRRKLSKPSTKAHLFQQQPPSASRRPTTSHWYDQRASTVFPPPRQVERFYPQLLQLDRTPYGLVRTFTSLCIVTAWSQSRRMLWMSWNGGSADELTQD
jgi:hypothetical protein